MSAVMSDQPTSNVAEFFTPGPGERLRAARLSMGYDLAKIASELHLMIPVVELLEADDFHDIGARVFVRGYLRNYARIVGMPVDSILRQFDEKWPDDGSSTTMVRQSPRLPADNGPGRGVAGAMTWLLLIGLVVLFLMWWRGYLNGLVPEPMRVTAPTTEEASGLGSAFDPGIGEEAIPDAAVADGSLQLPAPPADLPVEESVSGEMGQGTDLLREGGGTLALPGLDETRVSMGGEAPGRYALGADQVPDQASVATEAPEAASDGAADGAAAGPRVVLSFTGPCWVDVRDSQREFKLFGEMPKGEKKVLGGKPPYKIVIGNANAVQISVDGKPFDLTPYAKGNVARFTLSP